MAIKVVVILAAGDLTTDPPKLLGEITEQITALRNNI